MSQPPFFYNYIFQSTCPARGTTAHRLNLSESKVHFNPRAPRGARQNALKIRNTRTKFQSTCPARGTTAMPLSSVESWLFQSTCPARGTTQKKRLFFVRRWISIHVPREGHDIILSKIEPMFQAFHPRAPRGARRQHRRYHHTANDISIHVPREGHDVEGGGMQTFVKQFQSTCPARGTT